MIRVLSLSNASCILTWRFNTKNTLKLIYSSQFQQQTKQDFNYEVTHFIPEKYNLPLEGFANAWKQNK